MENNDKILHFPKGFSINEINNYLTKKSNILYYSRELDDKKEFHIVKSNESAEIKVTELIVELLKFYESNNIPVENINVKGNNSFSIISNISPKFISKLKKDLNSLLKK
jgi:hypothetical protein